MIPSAQKVSSSFTSLSLVRKFALAGLLVLGIGMMVLGIWVTKKIEAGVTQNTATSAALYMESFVAPLIQELGHGTVLREENREALDALLEDTELGRRVSSFKIWKEGGLVVYSSRHSIIGKRFPVTQNLANAWQGQVTAEFDTLTDEEDALERAAGVPLLEMYAPIHEDRTGRIIAVAEFYDAAEPLRDNLIRATRETWLTVAATTLLMFGALFGIVNQGSITIDRQRKDLEAQVHDLSRLAQANATLRRRVQRASQRTAELNEQFLKRVSADLHDGPAQLLSLALLRLDALSASSPNSTELPAVETPEDLEIVRSSLEEAIAEIRHICNGLILPELHSLRLEQVVRKVVHAHEARTGTQVSLEFHGSTYTTPESIKICTYRFIQEGLNNAFRHAGGMGQTVTCDVEGEQIEVTVSDQGPGLSTDTEGQAPNHGIGLDGLRERIESLGGRMTITGFPGKGTVLKMQCEAQFEGINDD
jgi:signal transduction histidine kinase